MKFLAINGDLANTITGGTVMMQDDCYKKENKYIIKAKLPSAKTQYLSVALVNKQIVVSGSVQKMTDLGVVFNMPFGAKAFDVPVGVNYIDITAYGRDGYLYIEMPVSASNSSKNHSNIDFNSDDDF